jgi:hypothetical protein
MLERIISQEDSTYPIGESGILSTDLATLKKELDKNENIDDFVNLIRDNYFQKASHQTDKSIIIDKSLLNFRWIGAINTIFPESYVINLYRDPMAICFSCLRTNFAMQKKALSFCSSQQRLVDFYRYYRKTIDYWEAQKIKRFKTFSYEFITQSPEKAISEIVKFVGFEYDKKFLEINKSKYIIKTASIGQANQKIYKGSSKSWMKYEKHLGTLIEGLKEFTN